MHGGVKVYRGAASAARTYVEADRSRADDYYLGEGTGLARRFCASPQGDVAELDTLDGDGYERWVAGRDPATGTPRGRRRDDPNAVRFVEIAVNEPKTWSLAASLHPEIAAAYDVAQDRAAEQIIGWVAEHATTRVGPRGRQVQVPVERVEAVTVRHYTSRAGDPHRHLHLQINARVFAEGKWRGLHTIGFRVSIEALNGIGHAAMMTDPEFRAALAAAGHPQPGVRRDPRAGAVRRPVQREDGPDRPQHRPLRSRVASQQSRPGTRAEAPPGVGPSGLEGSPAQTRSSRRMAPSWCSGGTTNCARSATATRRPSRVSRSSLTRRGQGLSAATRRSRLS